MKRPETSLSEVPAVSKKSSMPPPAETKTAAKREEPAPENPKEEGYVEPEVVNKVTPEVPEGIRPRITSPQPIDVKVSIDRQGHVTSATALQHGDGLINYLAIRAVAAAKEWTFKPASRNGKPVASTRTIHFVFEQ